MESLLEVLLELILQVFGDALLDGLLRARNPVLRTVGHSVVAAACAALFGVISVYFHPHHLIRDPTIRLTALVLLPFVNGLLMQRIGNYFTRRGANRSGFEHMVPAAVFSLVFGLVRFQLAK